MTSSVREDGLDGLLAQQVFTSAMATLLLAGMVQSHRCPGCWRLLSSALVTENARQPPPCFMGKSRMTAARRKAPPIPVEAFQTPGSRLRGQAQALGWSWKHAGDNGLQEQVQMLTRTQLPMWPTPPSLISSPEDKAPDHSARAHGPDAALLVVLQAYSAGFHPQWEKPNRLESVSDSSFLV